MKNHKYMLTMMFEWYGRLTSKGLLRSRNIGQVDMIRPCTGVKYLVLATAGMVCGMALSATTVLDFETEAERLAVPKRASAAFHVGVTNRYATSGDHAVSFACRPWQKGMPAEPQFVLNVAMRDWRGYERLVVDVLNLEDSREELNMWVGGTRAVLRLPPKGFTQWQIPLWGISAANITNVTRLSLNTYKPRKGLAVFLDRFVLLKKGERPPPPSGPQVGRDFLPYFSNGRDRLLQRTRDLEAAVAHAESYMLFREACAKAGQKSEDMLVGTASSMEKVMPRSGFSVRPVTKEGLAVRLARNEYESVQVLVAARGDGLKGVHVEAEGFPPAFAASNVECDVTGYVRTTDCPPYDVGFNVQTNDDAGAGYVRLTRSPEVGWWPDPILGFLDRVDIEGHDLQSFWIRVHCPSNQAPGVYRGALAVHADGCAAVRIPFAVRVNGFAVGRTSSLPLAVTFNPRPTRQWEGIEGMTAAAERDRDPNSPVRMWRRHDAEWTSFLADYLIPRDNLYYSKCIDDAQLRALKQLHEEGRSGLVNLGYWDYPRRAKDMDAWRKATLGRLVESYKKVSALGMQDRTYVYGCDEVPKNTFPLMRMAVDELRKALPGVSIFTTARDGKYGVGSPLGAIDWFTPGTQGYDPAQAEISRKAGHQVWWYVCCYPFAPCANMFVECPAIEPRLLMGAQTVKYRPDGFLYYEIALWNSRRCITSGPFTDWEPRSWTIWHGDGSWTCVGPDGTPVPTVRLENFRDGLEDYAYAKILEEKFDARGGQEDEWCRKARELLAVPRNVVDTMVNYTDDPESVYRWRDAMADLIEAAK